jgi:hypothetical protein
VSQRALFKALLRKAKVGFNHVETIATHYKKFAFIPGR